MAVEYPVDYGTVTDLDSIAQSAVRALSRLNDTRVNALDSQEEPAADVHVLDVPVLRGVYPVEEDSKAAKKSVYVDKNFRAIFDYLHEQSGWKPSQKEGMEDPTAQISGPPGSGKFQCTVCAARVKVCHIFT